jgi:hypothetical protein
MDSPHLLLPFPLGPPPTRALSLAECFTEGHRNVRKWTQRNVSVSNGTLADIFCVAIIRGVSMVARKLGYKGNKDDPVEIIPPEESTWYKMYVRDPARTSRLELAWW